jgi:5'-3' exoribonuclease 2
VKSPRLPPSPLTHHSYYNNPFRTKDLVEGRGLDRMCQSYLEGVCWVLNYYLQGPPSWQWFYPFHYSPCASDLLAAVEALSATSPTMTFPSDHSTPIKPVEQLMCVLPAESSPALPPACRGLMTSPSSPLADIFHPRDIAVDRGNAMSWLWVLLLPFIEVSRITEAAKDCEPHFSAEETLRNSAGTAFLYLHSAQCAHSLSGGSEATGRDDLRDCLPLESGAGYPLYGFVSPVPEEDSHETEESDGDESERVLCLRYFLPTETIHRSALIEGVRALESGPGLDLQFKRKKFRGPRRGGRARGDGGAGRGDQGRDGGRGRRGGHGHGHQEHESR